MHRGLIRGSTCVWCPEVYKFCKPNFFGTLSLWKKTKLKLNSQAMTHTRDCTAGTSSTPDTPCRLLFLPGSCLQPFFIFEFSYSNSQTPPQSYPSASHPHLLLGKPWEHHCVEPTVWFVTSFQFCFLYLDFLYFSLSRSEAPHFQTFMSQFYLAVSCFMCISLLPFSPGWHRYVLTILSCHEFMILH